MAALRASKTFPPVICYPRFYAGLSLGVFASFTRPEQAFTDEIDRRQHSGLWQNFSVLDTDAWCILLENCSWIILERLNSSLT